MNDVINKFKNRFKNSQKQKILKAQFGNILQKGWNWMKNSNQVAAIAENPSVMIASGQQVKNIRAEQNQQNDKNVKQG